jgi:hypothetical protein
VPSNPVRAIELPPNDETPRTRVAPLEEAERLLAALEPNDRVPYALAFYAGLRREEIYRLRWEDVEIDGYRLVVRKAKSAAGTNRRPPIAEPLREILRAAALRNASDAEDPVSSVSVMSGKLAERATAAWKEAGQRRITLHECRHTYASFLMAAGYMLKELMECMGHSDLQMVSAIRRSYLRPTRSTPPSGSMRIYRSGGGDTRNEPGVGHAVGHNCTPTAVRGGSLRSGRARAIPRERPAKAPNRRRDEDAGGGTRTPDTRIMIPRRFGSTRALAGAGGQKRGHNRGLRGDARDDEAFGAVTEALMLP